MDTFEFMQWNNSSCYSMSNEGFDDNHVCVPGHGKKIARVADPETEGYEISTGDLGDYSDIV